MSLVLPLLLLLFWKPLRLSVRVREARQRRPDQTGPRLRVSGGAGVGQEWELGGCDSVAYRHKPGPCMHNTGCDLWPHACADHCLNGRRGSVASPRRWTKKASGNLSHRPSSRYRDIVGVHNKTNKQLNNPTTSNPHLRKVIVGGRTTNRGQSLASPNNYPGCELQLARAPSQRQRWR